MNSRKIIIGDVHGCLAELKELLNKINLNQSDQLFFIGDLIDKGPDSLGVVRFVYELSIKQSVTLIIGNHEDKFLRYLHNREKNLKALQAMKITADFELLAENLTLEEITFLKNSYFNYTLKQESVLLLHGGITGDCSLDFSINHQFSKHPKKEFKGLELLTRTRHIDVNGKFVSLGDETSESKFWAEVYGGQFGKVIFGHNSFLNENPKTFPHAVGIDTGCVYGGWLTAVILNDNKEQSISVKAHDKYAEIR